MSSLSLSIISVALVSLTSLVGVASLALKKDFLDKILIFFVSFSAGSLIGSAFFHLLTESVGPQSDFLNISLYTLIGFCFFFALEKILHWHHCHDQDCVKHQHLGWMNLYGNAIHNFIDGMIIFAAFKAGTVVGIPVALSVIFHEIPHELGDFGVSIYAGFTKAKAIVLNLICALTSFLGLFFAYFLIRTDWSIENFLLPFAAGGFIYIAATDLVPELHKEEKPVRSLMTFLVFILALAFMYLIKYFGGA